MSSFTYSDLAAVPSCFAEKWGPSCATHDSLAPDHSKQEWGGCEAAESGALNLELQAFLGDPKYSIGDFGTSYGGGGDGSPWLMMDANCHWAKAAADTPICGFAGVSISPISLLWEEDASLEDGMTVVPFSIDATQPRAFSLWKASGKAPLLVFDPTHTGKVTSARQLFGTYAFGGRITKAAYSPSHEARAPWGNGYEALALLDTNHDGKLSAKELDALALWFDTNRDGVSQPGEVKSLSSLGVVAIYYKPDSTDPKSGDVRAELGYERLVNGKLIKGASVDWFSQTFSTRQEATVALAAMFQQGKKTGNAAAAEVDTRAAALEQRPNDPLKFSPHQAKDHREDLSGYWYWTVKEKNGEKHPGIFAFEQLSEHELTGYSVVEAQLAKNDKGLRSAVSALPATGTVERNKHGRLQLAMKIIDRKSGGTARSTATLSQDGLTLSGKTTQLLVVEGDGKRRSATVDYEWVARKFVAPTNAAGM